MSKAWIEQEHAFGNVSPFLQFQPSVHFPAFQVCIGRSIGCQSSEPSPDLHSAADIRCHTSPSGGVHTYMHIPKYVLAITNPFIAFPCHCHLPSRHASPLSWTTNSQCPGTTPISHRVSKLETHIFVIITHLGAQVDSWVCRGRRFDERETAALVLVVSRTWGGEALWRVRTYALHHQGFLFQTDPIYKRGFSQIRSFDKHCTEYICTSIGLGTIPFRLLLCFSKQPRYIWIIKERKVGSNMSLIHLPGEGNPLHISASLHHSGGDSHPVVPLQSSPFILFLLGNTSPSIS